MTSLCFGSTTSGEPGKSFRCSLNRYPRLCSALRTLNSGPVLHRRIPAIIWLRLCVETMSFIRWMQVRSRERERNRPTHLSRTMTDGTRTRLAEVLFLSPFLRESRCRVNAGPRLGLVNRYQTLGKDPICRLSFIPHTHQTTSGTRRYIGIRPCLSSPLNSRTDFSTEKFSVRSVKRP